MPRASGVGPMTAGFGAGGRPLVILGTGDSHMAGAMSLAPIVAGDVVATPIPVNTRSQWLNGSGILAPVTAADICLNPPLDLVVNVAHPATGPGLGMAPNTLTWLAWFASYLRTMRGLSTVTLTSGGVGGSASFDWSGNIAIGFFDVTAVPNPGDQFIVNGRAYTARVAPAIADEVRIEITKQAFARNIQHAINADGTAGVYGPGTTINADVFSPLVRADEYQGVASRAIGAAGNATVISGTGNLGVLQAVTAGDDTGALPNNVNTLLAAAGLVPDCILHSIGTNDSGAFPGWNCSNFIGHLTRTVDNYHTRWPKALIGLHYPPKTSLVARNTLITTVIMPAVAALVAARSYCFLVDVNGLPAVIDGINTLSGDGIHLSNRGYEAWGQVAATAYNNRL